MEPPKPDELVTRLATGDHPMEVSLRPEKTAEAFKSAIDRGSGNASHIDRFENKPLATLTRFGDKVSQWRKLADN